MSIDVVLVTQEACDLCERAGVVLARLAEELNLSVRAVPLESSEGQLLATTGHMLFAPGVFLDGELFSYGRLSERRLRRHLEGRGVRRARGDQPA